jgi:hypothetical protein
MLVRLTGKSADNERPGAQPLKNMCVLPHGPEGGVMNGR